MLFSRFGVLVCIDSLRVHFNPMHLHCIDIIVLDNMLMHSATTYFAHINYLATILAVSIGSWERKSSIPRDISITLRLFMRLQHCSNEIKVPNSLVGVQWAWQITRQISHRHVHIRWSKTGEKANSKCFFTFLMRKELRNNDLSGEAVGQEIRGPIRKDALLNIYQTYCCTTILYPVEQRVIFLKYNFHSSCTFLPQNHMAFKDTEWN